MLEYEESHEIWAKSIDKDWRDRNANDRVINKQQAFFLKIWDNQKASLPEGQALIPVLKRYFPSDKYCNQMVPLGYFKDLAGMSHKDIYNLWIERFNQPLTSINGKTTTMKNFCGAYMMRKWEEEFKTKLLVPEVSRAMSLRLYRGSAGMVLEDRVHAALADLYKGSGIYTYTPAGQHYERTGIDGYAYYTSRPDIHPHRYSIKNFHTINDIEFLMETRTKHGKTLPTHYVGYAKVTDDYLTFKEVDLNGNIQHMIKPPVKKLILP